MTKIHGEPLIVLERVQALVREIVPSATCELEDANHQIVCAAEDAFQNLHLVRISHYDWVEEIIRHKARMLRSLLRTGRPASD